MIIRFILYRKDELKVNKSIIICLVLILLETFHVYFNILNGINESLIKLIGFSLCLLVTINIITTEFNKEDYEEYMKYWTYGVLIFSGIIIFKSVKEIGILSLDSQFRRLGLGFNDSSDVYQLMNPNELGRWLIVSLNGFLLIRMKERMTNKKFIILTFLLLFIGLLSVSRTFIIVLLFMYIYFFIYLIWNIKLYKKEFKNLLLLTIIVIIALGTVMKPMVLEVVSRFKFEDITNNRGVIYNKYLKSLYKSDYIIFGSGMQKYINKYSKIDDTITNSTHNILLEIIVIWGLFGLFIVFLLFYLMYKDLNVSKFDFLGMLSLVSLMITFLTGQFFISYYNTFPLLMMAYGSIKYYDNN